MISTLFSSRKFVLTLATVVGLLVVASLNKDLSSRALEMVAALVASLNLAIGLEDAGAKVGLPPPAQPVQELPAPTPSTAPTPIPGVETTILPPPSPPRGAS